MRNRAALSNIAAGYDVFLVGILGLAQRHLIYHARRENKFSFQVLPAMLSAPYRYEKILANLPKIFPLLAPMLPSGRMGGSALIDKKFVVGEKTKQFLIEAGVGGTIYACGMPASDVGYDVTVKKRQSMSTPMNLLYICGAFAWHSMHVEEQIDYEVLDILRELIANYPQKYRLNIKLHPRAVREYLARVEQISDANITISEGDLSDAIKSSDVALSIVSTGLFEAINMGKPVIIILPGNRSTAKIDNAIKHFHEIPIAKSAPEAHTILENLQQPKFHATLQDKQQLLLRQHFAPGGEAALRVIGDTILRDLNIGKEKERAI